MLIRNMVYLAHDTLPPYRKPFLSIPVYAILSDGSKVVARYNHFGGRWIDDSTLDQPDIRYLPDVVSWYGPVVGREEE